MPFVRTIDEIGLTDEQWAGEKAARLGELHRANIDVPPGFVIAAPAFREHLTRNHIADRIRNRLSEIEMEDPVELEAAAEDIRGWIEQSDIPETIDADVSPALERLQGDLFAVRASRVIEDVVNPRASGLEQAFLGIPRNQVGDHVRKVWGTLWTSRAIYYRHRKKIAPDQISIAALVQPIAASASAGVLFTVNPLTGADNEMHVDATYGLGEAIVAARWKPDHYVVRKSDRVTIERQVVNKPLQVTVAPEGGTQVVTVASDRQDQPSLTDEQIRSLAALGFQIEALFKQPQDIEWCLAGNTIKVLQTRPWRKK